MHSDGAITNILNEFIDLGVDVVHPLEPVPITDFVKVKEQFGNQMSFLGGIDIAHAMRGSREDVVNEVKLRIAQLAQGDGYILAPSNHLQNDVPTENVVTLFQAAHELGKY
jgi:uroporphyrinogen decarboxylase